MQSIALEQSIGTDDQEKQGGPHGGTRSREIVEILNYVREGIPIQKWPPTRRLQFLRLFGGSLREYNRGDGEARPTRSSRNETAQEEANRWAKFFKHLSENAEPVSYLLAE